MISTRKAVVTLALAALAGLPLAGATALAADDGPIVHDYSKMGADYNAPDKESGADNASSASDQMNTESENSSREPSSKQAANGDEGKPYAVDCSGEGACKASQAVITGYEEYSGHCLRCHGETATGSSFGPSLVERLKGKEQGYFTAKVAGGVTKFNRSTQSYSIMPSWANNEEVMSHLTDLWAFLKARSDGALPPGRPQPMDDGS